MAGSALPKHSGCCPVLLSPEIITEYFPYLTASLIHSAPHLLNANDREDAGVLGAVLNAGSVVTFCRPGAWLDFISCLTILAHQEP